MKVLFQLIKFGFVGFIGMLIDFGVTYLLKEKLLVNKYVSNGLGFLFAASNNYWWNRVWTFQSKSESITQQYLSFLTIASVGLALNSAFVYLFHKKFQVHFYLAKLIATGIVIIWNFTMNYFFTFS